jgi:hypothetical protein
MERVFLTQQQESAVRRLFSLGSHTLLSSMHKSSWLNKETQKWENDQFKYDPPTFLAHCKQFKTGKGPEGEPIQVALKPSQISHKIAGELQNKMLVELAIVIRNEEIVLNLTSVGISVAQALLRESEDKRIMNAAQGLYDACEEALNWGEDCELSDLRTKLESALQAAQEVLGKTPITE